MKQLKKTFILVATAGLISFSSCNNEDVINPGYDFNVPVKVQVSVPGNNLTRTNLTELNGNLKWEWSETDKLAVTDNNGNYVGTLSLVEITNQEGTSASFEGNLSSSLPMGEMTLNFHYIGETDPISIKQSLDLDYSNQDGSFDSLKSRDILTTSVTANKAQNYIVIPDFEMNHYFSVGHFQLIFDKEPSEISHVEISGTNLNNGGILNLSSCAWTAKTGDITVKPATKDFYVTLTPANNLDMTFTAYTTEGKKFTGSMGVSFNLASGVYLRRKLSDAEYVGIPITMKEDGGSADPEYPGYENEDSRNPLHKFAKYNLTSTGDVTNDFADDGDNGALYQWGRNHGFIDNARNHASLENRTDFINWEDAFGNLEQPTQNGQRYWDFYVYSQSGETYYTGTGGVRLNPYDNWSPIIFDESKTYTSIDDLKANPTKWFMDGRYDQGKYIGNLGGYLFSTCNPDYWVWNGGGETWSERAELCGYDSNPCPEGWRLPTKEDFEAIAPYENINDEASLESLLRNHAEVRRTKEGILYAIRWLYRPKYLEIQAIIVPSDFLPSNTSDIIWENNPDVVVRQFPYTGGISAYGGYDGIDGVDMAYPYHMGVPDAGVFNFVQIGVGGNIGNGISGYWMEDKGYVFKFTASEITGAKTSYVKIESATPVTGYAIRPVMDK